MEFWGIEVKSGEAFKVSPGDGMVLHLSQASLGETKQDKGNESTTNLFLSIDGKKLVLGTLFSQKLPQQQFDLVFDRDFELSHNWKHGSVYFCGYKARNPVEEDEFPGGDSDEFETDEDNPFNLQRKSEIKAKQEKPIEDQTASAAKDKQPDVGKKVKIVEPNKEDDESSDDELLSGDDKDDSEGEDYSDEDDSDDDDDESDEIDGETPTKIESSKKRSIESASKTPVPDKKAKANPQGTDGKKGGGHVATPHPSKQAGKAPAKITKEATPKAAGTHNCKSCSRTFGSEQALDSHKKAKHGDGK